MGTHLVVLDRALPPQSLRFGLLNLASRHRPASFVLLQMPQVFPGESLEAAERSARAFVGSARSLLKAMGLSVEDALVGDPAPRRAIAAEMRNGRRYDGIVLTSRPPLWLRLLQMDEARRLERRYGIPVTCIEPDTSVIAGRRVMARIGG